MIWTLIVANIVIASWSDPYTAYDRCHAFKRMFTLIAAQCVLQVNI